MTEGLARRWRGMLDESYGIWPIKSWDFDFRWSKAEGYRRVRLGDHRIVFQIRANHPDVSERPVKLHPLYHGDEA